MPTTSTHALRYPASSDAPNVPQYIQNLASDVDALLARFVVAGTVSTKRLRLQLGSGTAVFSAIQFTNNSINFSAAGFTAAPHIFAITDENGSAGPFTYHAGNRTTTTGVITLQTPTGATITASVPFIWIAIGH